MSVNQSKKRTHRLVLVLAPVLIALCSACSGGRKMSAAPSTSTALPAAETVVYRISPGDNLIVKLYYHPELNTEVWVRPDGFISLELVGEIKVAGQTPAQVDSVLQMIYGHKLVNPEVAVVVKNSVSLKVFVGGEVQAPGLVSIDGGLKLLGAIFQAGGFKSSAQLSQVVLLRKDGPAGQPVSMAFDLRDALHGRQAQANVELHPSDVIYVPKSGIARVNQFMDEFVEGLLPVSTLSGFAWVYTLVK
ncbi:MAG: polysaccharide biosynthesis/export family protein [candidate division KSB1 bacterium]